MSYACPRNTLALQEARRSLYEPDNNGIYLGTYAVFEESDLLTATP